MTPGRSITPVDSATLPCPLKECSAVIFCIDRGFIAVEGVYAEIVGVPGTKATDKTGTVEFLALKPPNRDYTAKVTLSSAP